MNCWKCGGSGFLPEYAHVEDGKCFPCDGTGKISGEMDKAHTMEMLAKTVEKRGRIEKMLQINVKYLNEEQQEQLRKRIRATSRHLRVSIGKDRKTFDLVTALQSINEAVMNEGDGLEQPTLYSPNQKPVDREDFPKYFNSAYDNYMMEDLLHLNNGKRLGETYIDFQTYPFQYHLAREIGNEKAKEVADAIERSAKLIGDRFPTLVSNLIMKDFEITYGEETNIMGVHRITLPDREYAIEMSANKLILIQKEKENLLARTTKEYYERKKLEYENQFTESLLHELAHAYHNQIIYSHNALAFTEGRLGVSKNADLIRENYDRMIEDIVIETNLSAEQIEKAYTGNVDIHRGQIEMIEEKFVEMYGAYNEKEYFAIMVQQLYSDESQAKFKEEHPRSYRELKKILKGVIQL